MTIRCDLCGGEIVVGDGLAEGQHVRCPFCNGKFSYRRPARIVVPTATVAQGAEVSEIPAYRRNPNLFVRRPANVAENVDSGTNALVENVQARAKAVSRRDFLAKLKWTIINIVVAVVLLCIGFFACKSYLGWAKDGEQPVANVQDDQVSRKSTPQPVSPPQVPVVLPRCETNCLPGTSDQAAAKGCPVDKVAVKRVQQGMSKATVFALLGKARYDYWRNCPKELRPGSITSRREYACVVPDGVKDPMCLMIVAEPGKEMVISAFAADGGLRPIGCDVFNLLVKKNPYLIFADGKGWICGIQKDAKGVPVIDDKSTINPAQEELGPLYDLLCRHSAKVDLFYSVYFADKRGRCQFVKRVRFGEFVSAGDAKPVVRENLQASADAKRRRDKKPAKKFKRTVVFVDGPGKRPVAGPIEIPYVMPAFKGYGVDYKYGYWSSRNGFNQIWSEKSTNSEGAREREYLRLRAIAEREDREEAEWKRQQAADQPRDAHFEVAESEVEKVLFAGSFRYMSVE